MVILGEAAVPHPLLLSPRPLRRARDSKGANSSHPALSTNTAWLCCTPWCVPLGRRSTWEGLFGPLAMLLPPLLYMHSSSSYFRGCLWRSLFFFCLNKLSTCWLCCKSNLLKTRQEDQVLLSCDSLYFCCLLLSCIWTKDDSIASFIGRINAAVSLHLWYSLYPRAGAYV